TGEGSSCRLAGSHELVLLQRSRDESRRSLSVPDRSLSEGLEPPPGNRLYPFPSRSERCPDGGRPLHQVRTCADGPALKRLTHRSEVRRTEDRGGPHAERTSLA